MKFSIRTRLTFWYVALLIISLVVFGMSFFYALSEVYIARTDRRIESIAGMMAHTIIRPPAKLSLPRNFDIILERFFGIRTSGNYIQVLNPQGDVVGMSSMLEGAQLPLSDSAYRRALEGITTFETIKTFGVYPIRVVVKPIVMKDYGLVAIVEVGSSLEGMEEIFHHMVYFFTVGIMFSILLAGGIGWFLARKALKPVADITKMARRITVENLNERLEVKNPADELGRLSLTFNDMIARLERSFRQVKQFTEDASHELKTPLTIMKGELEVCLRSKKGEEFLRDAISSVVEEIDRMSYIVKNLLTLARQDVEKETMARKFVRFDKVVTEGFEQMRKMAVEKSIELSLVSNKPLTVLSEPVSLGQVVYNLIDNAIKYTPSGGRVEISLTEESSYAILRVMDTGTGISKEDLPFIFDRFYRVDKARTREVGGVGLGLSICKELIESFDGSIEAESSPGSGSVFTVRIPIASA